MTSEQLKVVQSKEMQDYWMARAIRSKELEDNQQQILDNTIAISAKSSVLLKTLLAEQRQAWEENERAELDLIKQYHQQQIETFEKKETDRQSLVNRIMGPFAKAHDRGGR